MSIADANASVYHGVMVARRVTDLTLLRTVLSLRDDETPSTARNVASVLCMSPSTIHRRLENLVEDGVLAKGATGYRLRPPALDLAYFREGHLYWQLKDDGELLVMDV